MKDSMLDVLGRFVPGLRDLLRYRAQDLPADVGAGLAVAAVAIPVGIAYAQLAGFHPVVGLYSCILPLLAYFLFGSSRQLIVGPDAATCALVALSVAPLAAGNAQHYLALTAALSLLAGLMLVMGSLLRLSVVADFLSRPILVGYLNGVGISIALGQVGKLFGFPVDQRGIIPTAIELLEKISLTHGLTLLVGGLALLVLLLAPRFFRQVPAALLAMILCALAVAVFGLEARGVAVLGEVPSGLPELGLPSGTLQLFVQYHRELLAGAAGVAFISFTSGMLTCRSFATKNRYDVSSDQEMGAFGAVNIAAALSSAFPVTGADSRTAMSNSSGGRTRLVGLVSAAAVALVLLFLTGPMQYVPQAALGAVLVLAGLSLVDLRVLRHFWSISRAECLLSLIATFGVIYFGALQAVLVVVLLALLRFLSISARPRVEVLGKVPGQAGFHAISEHHNASIDAGLVLFRFNGPLIFFNASYFKRAALAEVARRGDQVRWFALDMVPVTQVDVTGADTLHDLRADLAARGIQLVFAGRRSEVQSKYQLHEGEVLYPTLRQVEKAFRLAFSGAAADPEES